ncbi:MAG: DNA-directed RNA polymerase subunit beta' [Synergistaceae bacterium]|nr:DNA-directed RNA polymerase subunit beta' [Synergistaceae bacterium]
MAKRKEITGVRIKLATPDRIHAISKGEVTKPETINYRTLRPETDGLFCEKIFGPTRSYECRCGKYKRSGPKFKGVICEHCGVEVTDNRVRRERMGHIDLAVPVVHIWYLRGIPSRLSLLLGTSAKDLERVIYFAPSRKAEKGFKVTASARPEIIAAGDEVFESDIKIHQHYQGESFQYEEAFQLEGIENVPVDTGDVITAAQASKYKTDYGDDSLKVEPAYTLAEANEELGLEAGAVVPASKAGEDDQRLRIGNNDGFIVTFAAKLPYKKGSVLSRTELTEMESRFPGRFRIMRYEKNIDDPSHLVIEPGSSYFSQGDVIFEHQQALCRQYDPKFEAGIGADGVQALINKLDLDLLADNLREMIADSTGQKKRKFIKRLQVVEDFRKSDSQPQSMILTVLPVIPPDLRPLVQLDGGRFATSDLNDLYRRVINRNNRLKKLQALNAPEIIIRNEKRMLQECVDALIDNGRVGKAVLGAGNRPLKSLTDLLRGKKGRFRQNLLGKRVDYSGRSVIVIGPQLKIYQCGLPKQMALELFKPFVIRRLVEGGLAPNVKNAKRRIEKGGAEVWEILENIIKDHPVMLNRAPTLHRLGIQAFEPVLMEGKAIRLHPMVCTAFNADFDGDQMAVHVPLSIEAQAEARLLMLSANNLLSPASGKPVVTPTQDIVLGVYYLTDMREGLPGDGKCFMNGDDVLSEISHGTVHVNARIWLKENPEEWGHPAGRRMYVADNKQVIAESFADVQGEPRLVFFETSPGRVMFNSRIAPVLRFVNEQLGKKRIGSLLDDAYDKVDRPGVVDMLDEIKSIGYHWAARSGISFGVQAVRIPDEKAIITRETQAEDNVAKENYEMGLLTHDEYLDQKNALWSQATRDIAQKIKEHMSEDNPVRMMVDSGARGSLGQMGQMAGIRGLMADPTGKTIDYPITANFREGMNMLEYFISTHGARKGLADTALRTAKSGYLTRRLVDVSQDLIITEHDCGTDKGICIHPLLSEGKVMISIADRIAGRTSLHDIEKDGELFVKAGDIITEAVAKRIDAAGIDEVWVRSPLACALKKGICQKCYGHDLSSRKLVPIGEAVGVVAAQSIGEPGTQLTMRTFHTGGVRSADDITQGLPRIEQLFEVRRPRKVCILAGLDGHIKEIITEGKRKVIVEDDEGNTIVHAIPSGQEIKEGLEEGMPVEKLTHLTEGSVDPQQLLEVSGIEAVQRMLVDEIQNVYNSQSVTINNKHIEVILRKVAPLNKVRVIEEGDTSFVAGDMIWEDDAAKTERQIQQDNERRIASAVKAFGGDILLYTDKPDENIDGLVGQPITEDAVQTILTPGSPVKTLTIQHDSQEIDVILGKSAFRKRLEGLRLVRDVLLKKGKAKKGTVLTRDELKRITADKPVVIRTRDRGILERMIGSRWLAEDVIVGSRTFAPHDELITQKYADEISGSGIADIKVWGSVEHLNIAEEMRRFLPDKGILGKEIYEDGEATNRYVDDEVIAQLADGTLEQIDIEDEDEGVRTITRLEMLERLITSRLKNKILVKVIFYRTPEQIAADEAEEQAKLEAQAARKAELAEMKAKARERHKIRVQEAAEKGITLEELAYTDEDFAIRARIDELEKPVVEVYDESLGTRFIGGLELKGKVLDEMAAKKPLDVYVRAATAKPEVCHLIRDYTFMQRLREFPECRPFIHGITKAALATDSFLSAASFQQTAQVLAGAAVKGELDPLSGLKENVIIGHLIPAGTGSEAFRSISYKSSGKTKFKPKGGRDNRPPKQEQPVLASEDLFTSAGVQEGSIQPAVQEVPDIQETQTQPEQQAISSGDIFTE